MRRKRVGPQARSQVPGRGVGGPLYPRDATAPEPLPASLAVFARPHRDSDRLPEALIDAITQWEEYEDTRPVWSAEAPLLLSHRLPLPGRARRQRRWREGWQEAERSARQRAELRGSALVEESRLLTGPVGQSRHRLFGVPTQRGRVMLLLACGDACEAAFYAAVLSDGFHWHTSWRSRAGGGTELVAYGCLADEVVGVEVEISRIRSEASVGENGFLFETLDHVSGDLHGFWISYRDGTVREHRLGC